MCEAVFVLIEKDSFTNNKISLKKKTKKTHTLKYKYRKK